MAYRSLTARPAARFVLALLLAAQPLAAQTTAPATDPAAQKRARADFDRGIALYDKKDYANALAAFVAAHDAHPIPSLRKNIALCLRALNRQPEAIEQLELFVSESGPTLSREAREPVDKAIAEMSAHLGSVRVNVTVRVGAGVSTTMPLSARVAVDGIVVSREKLAAPLRLTPGTHVIVAQAPGYADASKQVVVEVAKNDAPVDLELIPTTPNGQRPAPAGSTRLRVSTNVASSSISIDGVPIAVGEWSGELPAGNHRIEVAARGYAPFGQSFEMPPNVEVDVPVVLGTMTSAVARPASVDVASRREERARNWQLIALLSLHLGSRSQSVRLGETGLDGTERGYPGGSIMAKGARKLGKFITAEVFLELGVSRPKAYDVTTVQPPAPNATGRATVDSSYLALVPEVRFHSVGPIRFVGGLGAGIEFENVTAHLPSGERKAKGAALRAVGEVGAQFQLGPAVFLETTFFGDLYGVDSVKDDDKNRFYLNSPATRGGLRIGVGFDL
jgi:hypothetical protein